MAASPRLLFACACCLTFAGTAAARQAAAPDLSRAQRAALQALVRAVERGTAAVDLPDEDWPYHLLRASDGSHYVAFSIHTGAALPAPKPLVLYVRLATRRQATATSPERSAVAEWLAGQTPAPLLPRRGIAIGDMPTYGAAGIAARGNVPGQTLQLLELERERAREKRDAQERARKAALEGQTSPPRAMLPFEDFDVQVRPEQDTAGAAVLRRSVTAGPGEYDLSVAWVDPQAPDMTSAVRVARRSLTLPPASTTTLALSSIIVADDVRVRETPVAASRQAAFPYSIGPTEITPARDHTLTTDERLAVVVQVINARATASAKPDVVVGYRVWRRTPSGDEMVGSLAPQIYNDETLPPDFDIARGHPVFAAVAVPLRTFKQGAYRLEIVASDRVAGTAATGSSFFDVIATPAALLRAAPPLANAFGREDILQPHVLAHLSAALRPPAPSAELAAALSAAREGRYVELVRADPAAPGESGARAALRLLGLFALGDTPASLGAPLREAEQAGAPAVPLQVLGGALRALAGNDREAAAAWDAALAAGGEAHVIAPLLIDAALRVGDTARAVQVGERVMQTDGGTALLERRLAAALIANGRADDALRILERTLQRTPADLDAQWLMLHALFDGFASGSGTGAGAAGRARFAALAASYAGAGGRHAALVREWLRAIEDR